MASLATHWAAAWATHIGFQKCLWVQNIRSNMLHITCQKKWRSTRYVNAEMWMIGDATKQYIMSQLLCADFHTVFWIILYRPTVYLSLLHAVLPMKISIDQVYQIYLSSDCIQLPWPYSLSNPSYPIWWRGWLPGCAQSRWMILGGVEPHQCLTPTWNQPGSLPTKHPISGSNW